MKLSDIMKSRPWKTAQQSPYGPVGPDNPQSDDLGLSPDMMEPLGDDMGRQDIYIEVPLEEGEYEMLFNDPSQDQNINKDELIKDILSRAQQWANEKKQQGWQHGDFVQALKQFFEETNNPQESQMETPKEKLNYHLSQLVKEFNGITIRISMADRNQIVFEVPSLSDMSPQNRQILQQSLESVVDDSVARQSELRVNSPPWR